MRGHGLRWWLALGPALAVPASLTGQSLSGGVFISHAQVARARPALEERLDGIVFGLNGAARRGMFQLHAVYQEGSLNADTNAVDTDLVEGELLLAVDPVPWAGIAVGPHLRSFVSEGRTERWVFFETRLRTRAVVAGPVRVSLEAWRVLASDVNVAEGVGSAYGMDGGVLVIPPRFPLHARLGYRVERVTFAGGTRRDTLERFSLSVGIGRL